MQFSVEIFRIFQYDTVCSLKIRLLLFYIAFKIGEKMENKLQKKMHSRHVTMLALGGAIGAGLFKGSGEAINLAGPSVILAFFFGRIVII